MISQYDWLELQLWEIPARSKWGMQEDDVGELMGVERGVGGVSIGMRVEGWVQEEQEEHL